MRVVVIAPDRYPVSSNTGGSVEISIYQIAKRISATHQVTIISRGSKGLFPISQEGNVTIVRIKSGNGYLARAINSIKKREFDCIQVENRPGYISTLRRHFPNKLITLVLHSLTHMSYLTKETRSEVVQKSDKIVCNSAFILGYYLERFPRFANKFRMIHLGVDVARFTNPNSALFADEKQPYRITGRPYTILYVGRVVPKKGVHLLIRAAGIVKSEHPNIRVVVVGRCSSQRYHKRLFEEAKKAGVAVYLIGRMRPSDIHRAYRLADCFVCPTQFKEAFGLVNIEAMASGVPVIASRRGGIPEIINESNGILVPDYKKPVAFAVAIGQLIESPALAYSLVVRAYQTVINQFTWEHVASCYNELYQSFAES